MSGRYFALGGYALFTATCVFVASEHVLVNCNMSGTQANVAMSISHGMEMLEEKETRVFLLTHHRFPPIYTIQKARKQDASAPFSFLGATRGEAKKGTQQEGNC